MGTKPPEVGQAMVWSDPHHPYHDKANHALLYTFSKWLKPDYHVHVGDCLDLGGIGHHVEDDYIAQYEDPIAAGLESLGAHFNKLFKINPKAKIVWIMGNHDERLRRFAKKNPAWRGIVDDPIKLLMAYGDCPQAKKIDYVCLDDFEDDYTIGRMHFCHGFSAAKHVASLTVDAYDESVTFGHAHTMQMFTRVKRENPKAGYCVGHLMAREGRRYLKGRPTRWVTGFGVMDYLKSDGRFTMNLIPIVEGGFMYAGRYWGA